MKLIISYLLAKINQLYAINDFTTFGYTEYYSSIEYNITSHNIHIYIRYDPYMNQINFYLYSYRGKRYSATICDITKSVLPRTKVMAHIPYGKFYLHLYTNYTVLYTPRYGLRKNDFRLKKIE